MGEEEVRMAWRRRGQVGEGTRPSGMYVRVAAHVGDRLVIPNVISTSAIHSRCISMLLKLLPLLLEGVPGSLCNVKVGGIEEVRPARISVHEFSQAKGSRRFHLHVYLCTVHVQR